MLSPLHCLSLKVTQHFGLVHDAIKNSSCILTNEDATATRTARKIIKEVFANIPETEKNALNYITHYY